MGHKMSGDAGSDDLIQIANGRTVAGCLWAAYDRAFDNRIREACV